MINKTEKREEDVGEREGGKVRDLEREKQKVHEDVVGRKG